MNPKLVEGTREKEATTEPQTVGLQEKVATSGMSGGEGTDASSDARAVVEEDGTLEESEIVLTAPDNTQNEAANETGEKTFGWPFVAVGIVVGLGAVIVAYRKRKGRSDKP